MEIPPKRLMMQTDLNLILPIEKIQDPKTLNMRLSKINSYWSVPVLHGNVRFTRNYSDLS